MREPTLEPWPTISADPEVQQHYIRMRQSGETETIARMCALQRGPALMTDAVFNEGYHNGNQFADDERAGQFYRGVAERNGLSTVGKRYLSGLAAFPGDPKAWVSGRGDVKAVLDERGWQSGGAVKTKMRWDDDEPEPTPGVDPKLIDAEAKKRIQVGQTLGVGPDLEALKEKLTDLRAGHHPIPDPE